MNQGNFGATIRAFSTYGEYLELSSRTMRLCSDWFNFQLKLFSLYNSGRRSFLIQAADDEEDFHY